MAVNEKTVNFCEFAEANQKMAFAKNIHIPNCFFKNFLSMKMPVFVDGNGKMSLPSMKRAVFGDGSPGYLLYLHDLDFSTRFARS